jgi:hypothetical protein
MRNIAPHNIRADPEIPAAIHLVKCALVFNMGAILERWVVAGQYFQTEKFRQVKGFRDVCYIK